jgi:hypothetical protein
MRAMRNHRLWFVALLGILLLPACGGGSGGPRTLVIPTTEAFDGYVGKIGNSDSTGTEIFVGDYLANPARGLVGFSLAGVPSGATILGATLKMEQFDVRGVPYTDLGSILLDHVDLGAAIDGTDYGSPAIAAAFAVLSTTSALEDKQADVTAQVAQALALGLPRADFRLRFTAESDGVTTDEDLVGFLPFGNGTNPPTLTIRYEH